LNRDGVRVTGVAFTPDLLRCAVAVVDAREPSRVSVGIYESRQKGGEWSSPVLAEGLTEGGYTAGEGVFSPDGRWLYFSSSRPPGAPGLRPRMFRAAVMADRLGAPEYVPVEPPSGGTFYPRLLADGGLAFTAPGPVGRDDLFVAAARGDSFAAPRTIEGDFNTPQDEWDLVETRDGKLRIWASSRAGSKGRTDLWFSRRDAAGQWSKAQNLAPANTAELETAPQLSPDDAVLFFLRYESGRDRMYWVDLASILGMVK
jgi:Tol biopolymer transport system component